MNKKGFTIIELAVSFVLVATISIMLLQLVLSLKELYLSGDVKTTLLNKQGIMTKKIYDDLNGKELTSINSCGLSCLNFNYSDGTNANLLVDPGNRTLTYKDYTMQLDNSSYFSQISFDENFGNVSSDKKDHLFKINIPIESKLIDDENFGIRIIKVYDTSKVTINKNANINSNVILSGVTTNMMYLSDDNDLYIKIFHQNSGTSITDYNTFVKNKNGASLSTLTSLEAFRNKKIDGINEELKNSYKNGYFTFLLDYNNTAVNNIISTDTGYLNWNQTSNFASKESLEGFSPISNANNGLTYTNSNTAFATILGSNYIIGSKNGNIAGNGTNQMADLYVLANEYYCKYHLSDVTVNGVNLNSKC